MGMDVYGTSPRSKTGEYFRNNVWWWHPLAEFCQKVAPSICADCQHWHTNDGDGLNNDQSLALAVALEDALDGPCGARMERAVERNPSLGPFSIENVREWVAFLKDCGGFEIN